MKTGTLRKEQEDWYVVYFVAAEDCDAVARVEMKLAEEDYKDAVEDQRVTFESFKRGDKFVAKIQDSHKGPRQINEHLKNVILGQ